MVAVVVLDEGELTHPVAGMPVLTMLVLDERAVYRVGIVEPDGEVLLRHDVFPTSEYVGLISIKAPANRAHSEALALVVGP